jgi:hypothetical protein
MIFLIVFEVVKLIKSVWPFLIFRYGMRELEVRTPQELALRQKE